MSVLPWRRKRKEAEAERRVPVLAGGIPDLRDVAAPDSLEERADSVRVGGRYVRVYAVTGYPAWVRLGLMDAAFAGGEVDAAYHVYPVPDGEAIRELTRRITQIGAQLEIDARRGAHAEYSPLKASLDSAWKLRERIQLGQDRMFSVTALVAVWARTEQELASRSRLLEDSLAGRAVHVRRLDFRQRDGLAAVLPLGDNRVADIYRNFDCGAAVALCPWLSADLAHPRGVYVGRNLVTGAPVFLDLHADMPYLTNPHLGVFATTGAGKTFMVNLLAARSALMGRPTVFIDPEGGYSRMVTALGGTVVKLAPGVPSGINPLDIEEDEKEGVVPLDVKVTDVKWLICAAVEREGERLSLEELAALEKAVAEEYAARGITRNPRSLWSEEIAISDRVADLSRRKKGMPVLTDLASRLERTAPRAAKLMSPLLAGGSMGIFDCPSSAALDAPLVAFDISDLDERFLRPLAMQVVLGWVWEKFVKREPERRKHVVVDEAWMFLRQKDTADFLNNMARRARKRNCSLIVISQSFREFAESAQGRGVLANIDSVALMQQSAAELEATCEFFRLPQGQKFFLANAGRGQALLRAGRQAVVVAVEASPLEERIITGKREED